MEYSCKLGPAENLKTACLVVGVFAKNRMPAQTMTLDEAVGGQIKAVLKRQDFSGDSGDTQMLYDTQGSAAARILLIGLGEQKQFDARGFGSAIKSAFVLLNKSGANDCQVVLPNDQDDDTYRLVRAAVRRPKQRSISSTAARAT